MTRFAAGLTLLSPLKGLSGRWTGSAPLPVPVSTAVSASLSAEDDFELGGEFLDVSLRAAERIAGFCVGGLAVAALWMISSML